MRISIDEKKVQRGTKIGKAVLLGTTALLIALFVLWLMGTNSGWVNPQNINWVFAALLVTMALAFLLSRVGMYYGNRYFSVVRPELALREHLKGLDRKHALMLFQEPTDYYLVEPGGVTVLIPRGQKGKTRYVQGKWKRRESLLQFWMGRDEPIGNPTADALAAMKKMNDLITTKTDLKVPVRSVIVFTAADAQLDIEPSPVPTIAADGLKDFLRGDKLKELPNSVQRKLREALGAPELPKGDAG